MNGITWEAIGVVVLVSLALLTALGAIWGKLWAISSKVDALIQVHADERADRIRIWERLDNHESRIAGLESQQQHHP